jgi:cobalt-zinc-cadmium efflux system outer membrane protein
MGTLLLSLLGVGRADTQPPRCAASPLGPAEVVQCALAQSLEVRTEKQALKALSGRRIAAGTLLPSNPTVAVSLAYRRPQELTAETAEQTTFFNWYVTLSQEIEIAGQRGARLDVADAAMAAQVRRVSVAQQESVAAMLSAYYNLLAAGEELRLTEELAGVADALSRLAVARAQQALLSPVDADVAQAEASRLGLVRIEARLRTSAARAALAALLGAAPTVPVEVSGDLEPDPRVTPEPAGDLDALVQRALTLRGELQAAAMERLMSEHQVRVLRRVRVPNLTLSAFAQRDGLNEQVFGGGVSIPLPLPAPLGPSRHGEIAEALARGAQAETEIERVRRRVQREVMQAFQAHQAQTEALRLIPTELVQRARADVRAIAQAVTTRQLPLREALLSQRSLIELLQAHIKIRHELALARVELLRATGLLVQGERP